MPDSPSPFDDPFADLFGKLPDPRTRDAQPDAPVQPPAVVSGSRRAAREAAAREAATGSSAIVPPAPVAAATSRPGADSSVAAASAIGADGMLAMRAPVATATAPFELGDADADAQTADAAAPALPYSRTGGNRVVTPQVAQAAAAAAAPGPGEDDLSDLFGGGGSVTRDETNHPRRRRRIGGWIALGVVLLLLGGIAAGGLWVWNTYETQIRDVMGWVEPADYEEGLATGEALVTISSGDNGSTISRSLFDAGVTKTSDAFYDMLVDTGQNPTFYPGVYRLQQKMTSAAALAALQEPGNKLENSALLQEGLTVDQILPLLAEGIGLPLEDFQAAVADPAVYGVPAATLEGWLFPAMYTFDPGATATDVIRTMVDRTVQSLDAAGVPVEDRERILTIGSIIQREARIPEDFAKVSRVIQNRLDDGMQLQMDSTAQYGYGEMHDGTVSSSGEALADDNAWNTYVIPGLPVGPIANPGDVAIDAAMHPAEGPWRFFVTWNMDTGETIFTSTDAEHEQAKEKWFQWCRENDNRGC